jgi:hypothetical protein
MLGGLLASSDELGLAHLNLARPQFPYLSTRNNNDRLPEHLL